MKRLLIMTAVLVVLSISAVFFMNQFSDATLANTVQIDKQKNNFVLHIRVENTEEGFQVLRSLEYQGEETVAIHHASPLISVSINQDSHTFTGSPVEKKLDPGDIYHIQQPLVYQKEMKKGTHQLFIKTAFTANGKDVKIDCQRDIVFN